MIRPAHDNDGTSGTLSERHDDNDGTSGTMRSGTMRSGTMRSGTMRRLPELTGLPGPFRPIPEPHQIPPVGEDQQRDNPERKVHIRPWPRHQDGRE